MDDKAKNASSYQADQEILDARGINMTVEEVAGLSTSKYSERVQTLHLNEDDMAFLRGLRRRIKNRLASQNSRRRSMEQLRRLTRELRAVRACKGDAVAERNALLGQRSALAERCRTLSDYVALVLQKRSDPTPIPQFDLPIKCESPTSTFSVSPPPAPETAIPHIETIDQIVQRTIIKEFPPKMLDVPTEKNETNIKKENFTTTEGQLKKICAKTVFLDTANSVERENGIKEEYKKEYADDCCVLNLSLKSNGRRHHGRKQSAPRRIAYAFYDYQDTVLDLKIKRETQ